MATNIFDSIKQPYISWKGSGIHSNTSGITARNIRPLTNNDPTNSTPQKFGLPRPMKHYRKGYFTTEKQYIATSTGGNLIKQLLDTPGGVTFQSYNSSICSTCKGVIVVNNWEPINNLYESPIPETQQLPPGFCCNQEKNALKRLRSANTIIKQKYYTTHENYLLNRGQLFKQNQFNYVNTGDFQAIPGSPESLYNTYTGNSILNNLPCNKSIVNYNPNNYKYSNQGAVSSSSRNLRLNYETINKYKQDIQNNPPDKFSYFTPLRGNGNIVKNCCCVYNSNIVKLNGQFTFIVVGKNSTLSNIEYLPIIQPNNLMNLKTVKTQINSNTIQYDVYYDFDTKVSSVNGILDIGFGFSTSAITYYNSNIQTINILKFGGVPLYGMGSQFKGLTSIINFTALDGPLISKGTSFASAFESMTNFNTDLSFLNNWNLLNVTNFSSMFSGCTKFNNGDPGNNGAKQLTLSYPALTNLSKMFFGCTEFNQKVTITDMSKVTTMESMFSGCTKFNNGANPLSFTSYPALTNLSKMFNGCTAFNQNVTITDMSKVTTMESMFSGCIIFNNGANGLLFNTTSNSLQDLSKMFNGCTAFNQTVNISTVSGVTTMESMFSGCTAFNKTITTTNLPSLTTMKSIFSGCIIFNNGDTGNNGAKQLSFTTSASLQSTRSMFYNCFKFNQKVSISNVYGVTTMHQMFYMYTSVVAPNPPLSGTSLFNNGSTTDNAQNPLTFETSSALTNTSQMFNNCTDFNQTVSISNVPSLTTMDSMFFGCIIFNNGDTGNNGAKQLSFTTSASLQSTRSMFYNCFKFNQKVSISNVYGVTSMRQMFYMYTSTVTPIPPSSIFNNGNTGDTGTNSLLFTTSSSLTSTALMFQGCKNFNQTVSISNVSKLNTMESMFSGCIIFNNGDTGNNGVKPLTFMTTNSLTTITGIFIMCAKFNQTIKFNPTPTDGVSDISQVTSISSLFNGCSIFNNGDIDNYCNKPLLFTTSIALARSSYTFAGCSKFNQEFKVSNSTSVTGMHGLFSGCSIFNNGNLYNTCEKPLTFTTSPSLIGMTETFSGCAKFNQTVTISDLSKVTEMWSCFSNCTIFNNGDTGNNGAKPLSFTTTASLTNTNAMFSNCSNFNQSVTFTNMTSVTGMGSMFIRCYIFNNGDTNINGGNKPLSFNTSTLLLGVGYIFSECSAFNQSVTFDNMTNLAGLEGMFKLCLKFNNGDTGNNSQKPLSFTTGTALKSTYEMFSGCGNFNQTVFISNVTKVTTTEQMFNGCSIFNKTITFTNLPSVTNIQQMFSGCTVFNNGSSTNDGLNPLSFTTSANLGSIAQMFLYCSNFNQTIKINEFNNSNVIPNVNFLSSLFSNCYKFNNGNISDTRTKQLSFTTDIKLTSTTFMFNNCSAFNQIVSISNVSKVTNMNSMFSGCTRFNNGFATGTDTNKLFPDGNRPTVGPTITNFGSGSLLVQTPSNRPYWMTSDWDKITPPY
jgi:hypothetical protein